MKLGFHEICANQGISVLRILTFDEPLALILRFEGVLDRVSTTEFHRAVSLAKAKLGTRKLLADVGSLKVQDRAAEIALLDARNAGVGFSAKTEKIAELLGRQEKRGRRFRLYRFLRATFVRLRSLPMSTCETG